MKKLRTIAATLFVVITAFTVTFGFTGCFDVQRSNKIRVCETARSMTSKSQPYKDRISL